MKQVIIKLQNGEIINAKPLTTNNKPRHYLEKITGLKYSGNGDIYPQTVGVLNAYMCNHSPENDEAAYVFAAAQMVIVKDLAAKSGGHVFSVEDDKFIVYVPCASGHYIIDGARIIDGIIEGIWSYEHAFQSVETIGESPKKFLGNTTANLN